MVSRHYIALIIVFKVISRDFCDCLIFIPTKDRENSEKLISEMAKNESKLAPVHWCL